MCQLILVACIIQNLLGRRILKGPTRMAVGLLFCIRLELSLALANLFEGIPPSVGPLPLAWTLLRSSCSRRSLLLILLRLLWMLRLWRPPSLGLYCDIRLAWVALCIHPCSGLDRRISLSLRLRTLSLLLSRLLALLLLLLHPWVLLVLMMQITLRLSLRCTRILNRDHSISRTLVVALELWYQLVLDFFLQFQLLFPWHPG